VTVLYVLVPMALLLVAGAVAAFLWATGDGQLDDLETPPLRMLHDDDAPDDGPPDRLT
jgi:cbb3-type cytochrome oxidase maturation protein